MKKLTFILLGCISALLISSQSFAETTMSQEGQYIFNSLGFYIGGVLVAFMAAGFCILEIFLYYCPGYDLSLIHI